jgi:hypothetical protein
MPYTAGNFDIAHQYVQFGGTLPGSEQWSCGLRLAPVSGVTPAQDQAFCDSIATKISDYFQRATTWILPAAKLTWVKVNPIDVEGHYMFPTTIQKLFTSTVSGGKNLAQYTPNQIALAVTLTTDVLRGPAHQGRFYLPLPALLPTNNDGTLDVTQVGEVKTSTNTFIADLNAISANYDVAVFSRKSGAATHRLVQGVKVGRVLDTIRRRRNKLTEKYV